MADNHVKTDHTILNLQNIFANFLKPGKVLKEKEILPGLKVKLAPIGVGKIAVSQNVNAGNMSSAKISACRVLSESIEEINGEPVTGETEEELAKVRNALLKNLLELPPFVIQELYDFYLQVEREQEEILRNPGDLQTAIENF